jgi:hypothetical protein
MTHPSPKLALVPDGPPSCEGPGVLLRRHFFERDQLAERLRTLDAEIASAGRLLAKERGVAFIRVEHLRQEFGG